MSRKYMYLINFCPFEVRFLLFLSHSLFFSTAFSLWLSMFLIFTSPLTSLLFVPIHVNQPWFNIQPIVSHPKRRVRSIVYCSFHSAQTPHIHIHGIDSRYACVNTFVLTYLHEKQERERESREQLNE